MAHIVQQLAKIRAEQNAPTLAQSNVELVVALVVRMGVMLSAPDNAGKIAQAGVMVFVKHLALARAVKIVKNIAHPIVRLIVKQVVEVLAVLNVEVVTLLVNRDVQVLVK